MSTGGCGDGGSEPPVVEYDVVDGVAFLRLNRPERHNALNDAAMRALRDALFRLDDDAEARVGVVCGNGRSFCAGADVVELQLRPRDEIERFGGVQPRDAQLRDLVFRFARWKPLVAALHGHVIGGGLHLALLCDLIVAESSAQLQVAEAARGSDPAVLWALLRARAGESFANEAVLTARRWTGEEAYRVGVANRLAADGGAIAAAVEIAGEVAANAPLAIAAAVRRRRAALEQIEVEANATRDVRLQLSDEYRARGEAFRTRRAPGSADDAPS